MADKTSPIHSKIAPEPVGVYADERGVGKLLFLSGMGSKAITAVALDKHGDVLECDIELKCID